MKNIKSFLLVLFSVLLAACGGGGGDPGSTTSVGSGSGSTAVSPVKIELKLSSATVSMQTAVTVTAIVTEKGAPKAGVLVSFTTGLSQGAFIPTAGTALTNGSGVATIQLTPSSPSSNGADLVVATVVSGGATSTASIGFVLATTGTSVGDSSIKIVLSIPNTPVTLGTPVTVTATVTDNNVPKPGVLVTFTSKLGQGAFVPAAGTALTDSAGVATVQLVAKATTSNGADEVVATIASGGTTVGASVGFTLTSSGTVAEDSKITVRLTLSSTTITQGAPATATATVTNSKGVALPGVVVTFTTKFDQGGFIPASGTALTGADGVATIQIVPKSAGSSGADEIVATVVSGAATGSSSIGFTLLATNVSIGSVTSDAPTIGSYGQTAITVNLNGAVFGAPVSISLTSNCGAKLNITPPQVTTTTNSAVFTAKDIGCGAERSTIAFTAGIVGTSINRVLTVGVGAPTASSVQFFSSAPESIFLKGSGYLEVALVTFRVVDQGGNPLPNESVKLDLTTRVGGLTLNDSTSEVIGKSDADGKIVARVNSGTVPTPVRVLATLVSSGASTVSSNLTVGVGLPSQRNFSLSQGVFNIEGLNYDGTTNTYTMFAADRSGNPVPVGTAINFITEGGQIQSSRQTTAVNGISTATAQFVSQQPKPTDGRVTITAYAIGEESFIDLNGNNVWDAGEPFQDLGDVYKDINYNGAYDIGEEVFPFGKGSACFASTNALLGYGNGIGANLPNTCDGTWGRAQVRRSAETVFSSSTARPVWVKTGVPILVGGGSLVIPVDGVGTLDTFVLVNGSRIGVTALTAQQKTACQAAFDAVEPTLGAVLPVVSGTAILTYTPGNGTCPASTDPANAAANDAQNLANRNAIARGLSTRVCRGVKTGGSGFLASDDNPNRFNPLPATTKLSVKTTDGLTVDINQDTVNSSLEATAHTFSWKFSDTTSAGNATFSFTTPRGNVTSVAVGIESASDAFIPTAATVACLK